MALNMALTGNGYFAVVGGWPARLLAARETMLSGVVPKLTLTVSANVYTEAGTANVNLGLYTMPTTSGGQDGALVTSTTVSATTLPQTVTLTVPDQTAASPLCYVVRLWVDSITGSSEDTVSRDGSTAVASEPYVPVAVVVSSVSVT